MSVASIITQFRISAKRFIGADQGNIAVIFAIAILPILALIGAAIDYSRVSSARAAMQAALDSTALMVSKDLSSGVITASQVAAKAQSYFNALYTDKDASNITVTATYTASTAAGSTILVNGSGTMTTDFLKVAGFPQLNFNTSSTTAWGNVRMRVAMALDNTGSMAQDGKIGALQTASKNLIDQLSALAKTPGDVYISIVPFAKTVNVGSSNYSQNWIDWSDWGNSPDNQSVTSWTLPNATTWSLTGPGSSCPFTNSNDGFVCTTTPVNASPVTSTIPSSGAYSGYICPSVDANTHSLYNGCWNSTGTTTTLCTGSSCSCGSSGNCSCSGSGHHKTCTQTLYTHNWIANAQNTWTGCVTDRTQNFDTQNTAPSTAITATLFPANQYYENSEAYCQTNNSPPLQPITPLSYDWTGLKNAITAMQPTGGTNQAIGLAWAWQSLMPTAPMNAPAEDPNYTYKRAIILLSDGLNTEDRWPGNGDGSTQRNGAIDARQKIMCDNIKAAVDPKTGQAAYAVYTIQVNTSTPADPTSSILQYCASSPENFFLLTSSSQVVAAFTSIGTSLAQLRVAK
jgi:Flp pilus assembly protein TadG